MIELFDKSEIQIKALTTCHQSWEFLLSYIYSIRIHANKVIWWNRYIGVSDFSKTTDPKKIDVGSDIYRPSPLSQRGWTTIPITIERQVFEK